jgi:hypothetical protein
VCVPEETHKIFEEKFATMEEGQVVEMLGKGGNKIVLERKNGQIILTETKK